MPPLNEILPPRFAAFCALFIGIARVKQTLHWTVPKPPHSGTMSKSERFDAITDLATMVS